MTSIHSPSTDSTEPPSWAQELLTWLVPRSSEESIPGDLLEEYREAVRPSRGEWRANVWYLRQVVGFLWPLAWMFVVLNASALVLRAILDTFAPPGFGPHSYQLRSSASTYAAVGTFFLAGLYAGYRMGRVRAGVLAAVTASAVGLAVALGFEVILFYAEIQDDPAKLNIFYVTGG
jgi:membrane-associated phospholipid phosphatase